MSGVKVNSSPTEGKDPVHNRTGQESIQVAIKPREEYKVTALNILFNGPSDFCPLSYRLPCRLKSCAWKIWRPIFQTNTCRATLLVADIRTQLSIDRCWLRCQYRYPEATVKGVVRYHIDVYAMMPTP
jgi:hypothetical protein